MQSAGKKTGWNGCNPKKAAYIFGTPRRDRTGLFVLKDRN